MRLRGKRSSELLDRASVTEKLTKLKEEMGKLAVYDVRRGGVPTPTASHAIDLPSDGGGQSWTLIYT